MRGISAALLSLALLMSVACQSVPLQVPTAPVGPGEKVLGAAKGSTTGIMLFQFIPINQNERFQKAYDAALQSKPGATRLVNPTISERWFWAWVLNGYVFTVDGTAVKPK